MTTAQNDSPLPGLDADAISRLAAQWHDEGLWDDVSLLANALWAADGEGERRVRWHHVVLAVGNFKREGGRRLHPGRLADSYQREGDVAPPARFSVPGMSVVLDREDRGSWLDFMDSLSGAGPATTTTLLAALWPTRHFVFDRRVHAVTNALRMLADLPTSVAIQLSSTSQISETLQDYAHVRNWLLSTSEATGQPLVSVERALYELDRATATRRNAPTRTWTSYLHDVKDVLGEP